MLPVFTCGGKPPPIFTQQYICTVQQPALLVVNYYTRLATDNQ